MQTISSTFQNPLTLICQELTYRVSAGGYVVTLHAHAGEEVAPDVWRFESIDAAREQWAHLQGDLIRRGYARV